MNDWEIVNQALVRKALSEFTHERILEPVPTAMSMRSAGTVSGHGAIP
jgi:siderophore synthetase component